MNSSNPPLKRPEDLPPIESQADLHRLWRMLMGEPGFASNQLWMVALDADGRCTPVIQNIEGTPDLPDPRLLGGLMAVCRGLLEEVLPGGSVAFLWARPGPGGLSPADRAWATALTTAAREAGVDCRPTHLANDEVVRAFTPDDGLSTAG